MFVVYSKQNGAIKNIATGGLYNSIEDLFPDDHEDFNIIYGSINVEDDLMVINNSHMFKVVDEQIVLKEENFLKYRR